MLLDDPQDWVHVLADEVMWPRQPIGREIAGTRESVRDIERSDLRRYLDLYYGANNAVVSVAGGVDLGSVTELAEQSFGEWATVAAPAPQPATVAEAAPRRQLRWRNAEQVNLCLGFPGASRASDERWPLAILTDVLGGGPSSRLFLRLRERLGLAYDVQAYSAHFSDTGSVTICAGVDPANVDRVLDSIQLEIDRLQTRRVPPGEMRRVKQGFRGRLWLGLEDTHSVAGWFGVQEVLDETAVLPEDVAHVVDDVSTDDILRVARTYLRPERSRLTAVGPLSELGRHERRAGA
jgi:predicted Zn-dependent peptidase